MDTSKKENRSSKGRAKMHTNKRNFTLTLNITKNEITTEEIILETLPDEIMYSHKFQGAAIIDNNIHVLDKYGASIHKSTIR